MALHRPVDLLIKSGTIVTPTDMFSADVAVADGKIVAIGKGTHLQGADQLINAEGKFLLPGVIDTHVHFRDPGFPQREDFESGSRAAASGGITMVVDMPNSVPTVVEPGTVKMKAETCEKKSLVDFGLYGGAGTRSLGKIKAVADAGVLAFKTLLANYPTPGREPEFIGLHLEKDESLIDVSKEVAETGVVHVFHAETDFLIRHEVERLKRMGRTDPLAHVESRPAYAEVDAISRIVMVGREYNDKVHIAHMSSEGGTDLIRATKSQGTRVTAETCTHYLLMTRKYMETLGTRAKIQPPLRDPSDQAALWQGLNDGTIDSICSDHSPFTEEEKNRDIWQALPGAPDMENMVPLMLNSVKEGRISLNRLAEVSSVNPAKIFGIYPRKGAIQVGSDADITIVDLKAKKEISSDAMETKARKHTIFEGWKVIGWPVFTVVRGNVVMRDGHVVGKPGTGRWITLSETAGQKGQSPSWKR